MYCLNYYEGVQTTKSDPTINKALAASRSAENSSNGVINYQMTLSTTRDKSATLSVTESSQYSYGYKITLGVAELGLSEEYSGMFEVNDSQGSSSTISTTVAITNTCSFSLKPGGKKTIDLYVVWKTSEITLKIPIHINGYVAGNYCDKQQVHCLWFMPLCYLTNMPPISSSLLVKNKEYISHRSSNCCSYCMSL